jgi:hypothetical protein
MTKACIAGSRAKRSLRSLSNVSLILVALLLIPSLVQVLPCVLLLRLADQHGGLMSTLVNRNRHGNSIRERIAVHEAGHVIAAVVFGIPITRATIVEDPQVQCGRYHTDLANLALEANVTFYRAGRSAEALHFGTITDGRRQ